MQRLENGLVRLVSGRRNKVLEEKLFGLKMSERKTRNCWLSDD